MGFKPGKNAPPMERELGSLLADLCVNWGFCIPPDSCDQISKAAYYHADDFAHDVLKAEGMDSSFEYEWAKKISARFRIRFGGDEIDVSTFVDRGEKGSENDYELNTE